MTDNVIPIPYVDPLAAFAPFRDEPMSLLLHSCGPHPAARWSFLLVAPVACLNDGDGLEGARDWLRGNVEESETPFPWGAAGFLAYELGASFDEAAPRPRASRLPRMALGLFDVVIAFDHATRTAMATYRYEGARAKATELIARLGAETSEELASCGVITSVDPAATYREQVRALAERIRAGELYQANISRRFAGTLAAGDHPYALFARLCRQSPAPFCAYMRLPDAAIVSNSPERFLSVRNEVGALIARSSPIKGTRPRHAEPQLDKALADDLAASVKDRAENLMILDLMRNDLSRVSVPGSVRVTQYQAIETFANAHHMVSTVESRLKPGADAFDLLRAAFPAGSITGAPKVKAMELIDACETAPREANYGSLAWFGPDGAMDSSVLIRTATCTPRDGCWDVGFRVGGGITSDSDPEEEAQETETKARSLLRAIRGFET
jgi:para-aminobenzoate synthetase component I